MIGKLIKQCALTVIAAVGLAACGGGGGDPSVPDTPPDDGTPTNNVVIAIVVNPDNAQITGQLTISTENTIQVTVTNNGTPVSGELINVSTTIGSLNNSTILTNSAGVATTTLNATAVNNGSAGTITATYQDTDLNINENNSINVEATNDNSVINLSARLYDAADYEANPPMITRDPASGAVTDVTDSTATEITTINVVEPAILEVVLLVNDAREPNAIINVLPSIGAINPSSGQIITNDAGIATIELSTGTATVGEAGQITISASNESITEPFSISSSGLLLGTGSGNSFNNGSLTIANPSINASGNTNISVNVVDSTNALFNTPVEVSFTSPCIASGQATITSPVTSNNGLATTFYSVNGCQSSDVITASISEVSNATASSTVSILATIPNSISFTSATPTNIALKGTAINGRVETSNVIFNVTNDIGEVASGITVNFSFTPDTGNITLQDTTAISDINGNVTAVIESGNVPTSVTVIATISLDAQGSSFSDVDLDGVPDANDTDSPTDVSILANKLTATSDGIIISTGLADQDSFTVSSNTLNPGGGGGANSVEATISVSAADKFNNPVPDGTAITFTTEFGKVQPSCTTSNGECSVTWTSTNPKSRPNFQADQLNVTACTNPPYGANTTNPAPCRDNGYGNPNGALGTILAYTSGEESFIDSNANGLFDSSELASVTDRPEAFLDHNGDGSFGDSNADGDCNEDASCGNFEGDDAESFIDFNNNGRYDGPNGIYNGSLCTDAAANATPPTCTTELINVYGSVTLVLSDEHAYFGLYNGSTFLGGGSSGSHAAGVADVTAGPRTFQLDIADIFNGPLPNGTTVNVSANNCTITSTTNFAFNDTNFADGSRGFETFNISLEGDDSDTGTGDVNVTVTTPTSNGLSGVVSEFSFTCVDTVPAP